MDFSVVRKLFRPSYNEPTAIGIRRPDGSFDEPLSNDWVTLESDAAARMYRNDVQLLFDFGAGGAIRGIKGTMSRFAAKGVSARRTKNRALGLAAHLILEPIEQEIYNVLALSLQGHFEKAFRRWLRNSLKFVENHSISDDDIVRAQWVSPKLPNRDLGMIMSALRGVHLSETVEGPLILELALVGNVVRHGDGPSARAAYDLYPNLFDPIPAIDGEPAWGKYDELPERLHLTEENLATFAQAVFQFWHRVQMAYTGEY